MSLIAPIKDPEAILSYAIDWAFLLQDGETITSQTVTAVGGTVSNVTLVGSIVRWLLSGGVAGKQIVVSVTVVTSMGQKDKRSLLVPVHKL